MKKMIFLTLVLSSTTLVAKEFYQAKIVLQDDGIIVCFATLPNNKKLNKSVVCKSNLNNKETFKIENDQIKTIFITTNKGKQYTFERNKLYIIKEKKGEIYSQESKKTTWQAMVFYDDEIQVYYTADFYIIDVETDALIPVNTTSFISINYISVDTSSSTKISYKRKQENAPTYIIDRLPSLNGMATRKYSEIFKANVIEYFRNDLNFVEIIEDKDIKYTDYIELVWDYIEYKQQ